MTKSDHTLNLAHSSPGTDQSWPETLVVWKWEVMPSVCCHVKGFFLKKKGIEY